MQVVVGVEGDPGGPVELPVAVAELAPLADRRAFGVVAENPVMEGVGAPDRAIPRERETLRPLEVARAHLAEELVLDPMLVDLRAQTARAGILGQADIGDVHRAGGRHRDRSRIGIALRPDKVPNRVVEMPGTSGDGGGQHGLISAALFYFSPKFCGGDVAERQRGSSAGRPISAFGICLRWGAGRATIAATAPATRISSFSHSPRRSPSAARRS